MGCSSMKRPTVKQQLRTALVLWLLLLVAGTGLAVWMERMAAASNQRLCRLEMLTARITAALAVLSDSEQNVAPGAAGG